MLKCDSCAITFQRVGGLFEHIQSSCLAYYQSHPQAWAKILSKLGSENREGDGQQKTTSVSPLRNRAAPSRTVGTSKPAISSNSETPGTSSVTSNKGVPFVCKCEAQFKKLENFKAHLKVCTPGKEPPFCIMFKAQDADGGKSLKNVHMTVNDYFYGMLPGKSVKMKKINRRCNCYSCGKNLRNNVRYMSHVRHKIINEWEKKEAVDARNICQHCYRQYDSPFLLQCHLENVHGSVPAACTCRICELHFTSERNFLFHMKDKHVHNETPYCCKVCNYRSSFYNDVIKHFRDEHGDTSALMCPFCLAVSFNSSSFLRHVLQHIKKGAECQRCRLIFTNMRDKASHLQTDHISQLITEKHRKYKNLQKCQIYVRVASFQMTQRQHLMQKSPERFSKENGSVVNLKRGLDDIELVENKTSSVPRKKALITPCVELPAYLCPLKKAQKMRKVRVPMSEKFKRSTFRCVECNDLIQKDSAGIIEHFKNVHECRWCVFITSCEKASYNHVLKEHADAELREQLVGKSESDTGFAAILDDDDDISFSNTKEEPKTPPLPINVYVPNQLSEDSSETEKCNVTSKSPVAGSSKLSKPRRKQSNPMKLSETYFENSPSPKKVRREKKVQVRVLEAEKGTQACDLDFKPDDPDVQVTDSYNTTSKRKSSEKASANKKLESSSTKTPAGSRHRKILAPEGYFPDIEDDAGWAKYFAEVEGAAVPVQDKATNGTQTSTPMTMPKTSVTSSIQLKSVPAATFSKTIGNVGSLMVTSRGTTHSTSPAVSSVTTNLRATKTTKAAPWANRNNLPTMVSNAGPVFRFQVVPGSNPLVPSGGFSPSAGALRPMSQTSLVTKVQKMLSQVPQSPVDLRCLEFSHSSMLIQWDAPANCIVTQYKVIFQGSGAPTVQLLPPEQTLVRLVGLKSDTMYVVRVYSLCNKAVSQYAFLYQRTNKMPRDNTRPGEDVVLVVDDEPSTDKSSTEQTTASAMGTSTDVVMSSPTPKISATQLSQPLGGHTTASSSQATIPASAALTSVENSNKFQTGVVKDSTKEKTTKKLLIDELVSSLKKNRTEKANGSKLDSQTNSIPQENPMTTTSSDAKAAVSSASKVSKASDDTDSVVDGDAIYMVLDSPGRGDINNRSDAVKTKDQSIKTGSKLRTILPKPPGDGVSWVTVIPRRNGDDSEITDSCIQITSVKSNNSCGQGGDDKPDIVIEKSESSDANAPKNADMEVNIVNVVSLSKKPELKKQSSNPIDQSHSELKKRSSDPIDQGRSELKKQSSDPIDQSRSDTTDTGPQELTGTGSQDDTNTSLQKTSDMTQDNHSLENGKTDAPTVQDDGKDVEKKPNQEPVASSEGDGDTLRDEEETQKEKPDEVVEENGKPIEETEVNSPERSQVVSAPEKEEVQPQLSDKAVEEVLKPEKMQPIGNVVIVLNDLADSDKDQSGLIPFSKKEVRDHTGGKADSDKDQSGLIPFSKKEVRDHTGGKVIDEQKEKDMICEISLDVPIQSSEVTQSQESVRPILSLMPQPLETSMTTSNVTTSPIKCTLDENTEVLAGETKSDIECDPVTVFIDNIADDASNGVDIDEALDNEIKILNRNTGSMECGSGPTLDDIKDIMDDDLSWL